MIFLLGEEAIPKRIGYTGSWPKTGAIHGLINGVVPNEAVRRVAKRKNAVEINFCSDVQFVEKGCRAT